MLGVLLIWNGAWSVLLSNFGGRIGGNSSFAAVLILLAGAAIYLQRAWGYYIVYAVTAASWLTRQSSIAYWPFSPWIARKLFWIGIDRDYTIFFLNLLFVGTLAWTHYRLQSHQLLGLPLSGVSRRRLLVACLVISGLAVLVPALFFVSALFVDPPGGRNPGGPSGGMFPFLEPIPEP